MRPLCKKATDDSYPFKKEAMTMARERSILQKLYSAADLMEEPVPGLPLLELVGDQRVLIERHQGVTEYGRERIMIKVKFGQICVCGSRLELSRMTKGQLIICGRIDNIQLCRGCG